MSSNQFNNGQNDNSNNNNDVNKLTESTDSQKNDVDTIISTNVNNEQKDNNDDNNDNNDNNNDDNNDEIEDSDDGDNNNDNNDDDKKNDNNGQFFSSTNPMSMILEQFIKDTMENYDAKSSKKSKQSKQSKQPNQHYPSMPIKFDFIVENYDDNGKKETVSISSSDGNISLNDKNIDDVLKNDNDNEKDNRTNRKGHVGIKKDNLQTVKKIYGKLKSKIDYASSVGDLKLLDEWISQADSIQPDSYTSESIDNASANGKIEVLEWWKNASAKYNIELKYTEKAINLASKYGKIDSLNWWINSGLELKYNHNAIDYASSEGDIEILDWWLFKSSKDKVVKFKYTSNAIDNAKLEEPKLLKLVKWWNNARINNTDIVGSFEYTRDFIDYLESWNYIQVYDYLVENELISNDERFNPPSSKPTNKTSNKMSNDSGIVKMFEFMGIPIGLSSSSSGSKKQTKSSSKYDLESLPEDIQKHIAEKEEELNNNMMINGKAKEYIDNLVKIPFGKYKFEKIFCFVNDLINKINLINSSSSSDFVKEFKLSNESDLIKFFDSTKFYPDDTYLKYQKLYTNFVEIRKNYMSYVDEVLNDCVYGHDGTKKHIKCIISQWLSGGFKLGVVIGIQGPPGVGKTTMIKGALSKCLVDFVNYDLDIDTPFIVQLDNEEMKNSKSRPFCFTSLGGTTNGSTLSGHNITYHGATSGDIVKHLKEAEIMNPIIYFDELDKISNTEHGHEISSVLTHITDPAQNSHFTDRYFAEVKIDLSKAIIVFSYNDTKKIDRILLDRIQEIRLNPIKPKEKLIICRKFIIPEVCSQLGYNPSDINISDNELNTIINEYTMEAGVRKLKEKLFEVFRMRHLELIENPEMKISNTIGSKFVSDTFGEYPKITHKKIKSSNMIGCINGMYASVSGLGGITPIQVKQIYCKDLLGISITGSVEKVMEESVRVAKTVGWNLLTREQQDQVIKNWDSRGFHIHFPDGATPKDGPSGGTAITCAIYSLLVSKPVKNNVAITGEIDLDGNVTEIGGLDAKLNGAKKAGVKLALVPKENQRELEIVKKNNPELIGKNFKVIQISHVKDALKYIF
jgi:ATP-dependent Lon protease